MDDKPEIGERGEPACVGTGGVDGRAIVAGLRRAPDDAAVDEWRAGLGDDVADLDLGRRADRVAVDIDRFVVMTAAMRSASASASLGGRIERK
jgi:hypothetical protein